MEFSECELPPAHVQVGFFHLRKMLFIAPPTSIYIYPIKSPSHHHRISLLYFLLLKKRGDWTVLPDKHWDNIKKSVPFRRLRKRGFAQLIQRCYLGKPSGVGKVGSYANQRRKIVLGWHLKSSMGHVFQCEMRHSSCDWWVRKNVVDAHVLLISCVGSAGDRFHIDV